MLLLEKWASHCDDFPFALLFVFIIAGDLFQSFYVVLKLISYLTGTLSAFHKLIGFVFGYTCVYQDFLAESGWHTCIDKTNKAIKPTFIEYFAYFKHSFVPPLYIPI
ncbi:MAG: hypothetical protein IKV31_05375 [Paludibacteraceae bacterium]|nr:hypothetical protein [Paludibacteraceae bacterium]